MIINVAGLTSGIPFLCATKPMLLLAIKPVDGCCWILFGASGVFIHNYLPHLAHLDQTSELVCQSLRSRPTQMQELFTLAPYDL